MRDTIITVQKTQATVPVGCGPIGCDIPYFPSPCEPIGISGAFYQNVCIDAGNRHDGRIVCLGCDQRQTIYCPTNFYGCRSCYRR